MANVVFLWHMHQPYYVDPATRTALMPWVRLHGIKGYLDMISVIQEHPTVRMNFNLSPVLVLQIRELLSGEIDDLWLQWSRKPAAELDEEERLLILENFFKLHREHLVKPYPRFWELLNKRGLTFYREEVRRGLRYFSNQELLDLQVWFNLAWFGYTAERLFPEIAALKMKGRYFTEAEKLRVLELQMECLALVLQRYREAEERGQVELTTTPFFHPILPLVYDSALAERSLPGRTFPPRYHWPQDAAAQLTLAVEQHAAAFGRPPRGLWPSEGSIAPELIPLMQQSGLQYFCSDEDNLFASLKLAEPNRQPDHLELFQGYQVSHDGATVKALFREKPLSDFIGFLAAQNNAQASASHLLHHLKHIAKLLPDDTGVIPLILDGENAWETFTDGGEAFLHALYSGLAAEPALLHSCTMEDYFLHHPPQRQLRTLHTGSWIGNNFDTWIGEAEENRAWELLGETRTFLQQQLASGQLTVAQQSAALREIYAAEGSDWFWWYGPDFSTENDRLFDELFRQHLKHVYAICQQLPPPQLDQPVITALSIPIFSRPTRHLSPLANGQRATYYEWNGAGVYEPSSDPARRPRGGRLLERLLFGNDTENLYLRLDLRQWEPLSVQVQFSVPTRVLLETAEFSRGQAMEAALVTPSLRYTLPHSGAGDVIEFAIPLSALGWEGSGPLSFQVKLLQGARVREVHPGNVPIEFTPLGEAWELEHWSV